MNTLLFVIYLTNANTVIVAPPPVMFFDMKACLDAGQTMNIMIDNQNKMAGDLNHINASFQCAPVQKGTGS